MIYFLFEVSMTLKLASGVRIQSNKKFLNFHVIFRDK